MITNNRLYGKISVFFNCASQCAQIDKIKKYNSLYETGLYNLIALPYNINNDEPGDNYDIYQYFENVLGVRFPVCEKLYDDHVFFRDFSLPTGNFTNYIFDKKLKFIIKIKDLDEVMYV